MGLAAKVPLAIVWGRWLHPGNIFSITLLGRKGQHPFFFSEAVRRLQHYATEIICIILHIWHTRYKRDAFTGDISIFYIELPSKQCHKEVEEVLNLISSTKTQKSLKALKNRLFFPTKYSYLIWRKEAHLYDRVYLAQSFKISQVPYHPSANHGYLKSNIYSGTDLLYRIRGW